MSAYAEKPLLVCDNSGKGPIKVPGFGIDLDYELPDDFHNPKAFGHGIKGWSAPRLLVREVAMLRLMDAITDKPNWHVKVFDEVIVERWHNEATAMPLISEHAWTWCLRELREKAKEYADKHYVLTYDTSSRIAKSDELLSPELRAELIIATRSLMNVPPAEKDWHPGTDDKVLNLVHPSLYPLVYGQTRVLSRGGRVDIHNMAASMDEKLSDVAPEQTSTENWAFSKRFQWLPCDVEFSGPPGSTDVRIASYINNLHPEKNKPLYGVLEKLIGLAIPLWNDVLVLGRKERTPCRIITLGTEYTTEEPEWCEEESGMPSSIHDEGFDEFWAKVEAFLTLPDNEEPDLDDEEDPLEGFEDEEFEGEEEEEEETASNADTDYIRTHLHTRLLRKLKRFENPDYKSPLGFKTSIAVCIEDKWRRVRVTEHPEPGIATTYENWKDGVLFPAVQSNFRKYGRSSQIECKRYDVSLQDRFRDLGLQVIVKLASIELTPEKPEYAGGNWHLEGMLNEHIVATALFYYDIENVSDSRLVFRQEAYIDDDLEYEQSVHGPLCTVFGTTSMENEPAVQELGAVLTNPTRPVDAAGSASQTSRVLAFPNTLQHSVAPFSLVDRTKPGHRRFAVLWLVDPNYRICSTANVPPQRHDWFVRDNLRHLAYATPTLPPELLNMVGDQVGEYPMGRSEAERLRLELMAERTRLMPHVENSFETYNLCEH